MINSLPLSTPSIIDPKYLENQPENMNEISERIRGLLDKQFLNDIYKREQEYTSTSFNTSPKFIGGPKDGQLVQDRFLNENTVYCAEIPPTSHPIYDSDGPFIGDYNMTKHTYNRGGDGNFYSEDYYINGGEDYYYINGDFCRNDYHYSPISELDKVLIERTRSDKISMSERIKMRDLVKDPEWQTVRKSLIGQWKKRPEWCCKQLSDYIGDITRTPNKKLRIVMNYLTGSGFRSGRIKHSCIQNLRNNISIEIANRKTKNIWESINNYIER